MRSWLDMFGRVFEEPGTYSGAQPDDEYLRALLKKDTFIALAALNEDAVVGGLAAYVFEKFEQERSEVYVYDLAIDKACRREGIATALIGALNTIAASLGAHVIWIQTDRDNQAAIALYGKLGRREEILHFEIDVNRHE